MSYTCRVLEREPAGAARPLYFTVARRSTAYYQGLVVEVMTPAGEFWIGVFDGAWSGRPASGVYGTPDPHHVMVVSEGAGYWVPVGTPLQWEAVAVFPVTDVRRVPGRSLVLVAGLQDLAAYGPEGLTWRVERLGVDGVTLTEVGGEVVTGTALDAGRSERGFVVDLAGGVVRTGPADARTIHAPRPPGG